MPVEEKAPRRWAQEIATLNTLQGRRAALAAVPERIRPMVETHLKLIWQQRKKQ